MAYPSEGTLTTEEREVSETETWDTQSEWEAAQSMDGVEIVDGSLQLAELDMPAAIYDYGFAWYRAPRLELNDDETVSTFTDESETGNDLTMSGDPTYQTGVQNGEDVVRFDGSDDGGTKDPLESNVTAPYTFVCAVIDAAQGGDTEAIVARSDSNYDNFWIEWNNSGEWRVNAGDDANGGATAAPLILSGIVRSDEVVIRENGSQTGQTSISDPPTLEGLQMAETFGNWFLDGDVGEVGGYDADMEAENELADEEQRMADFWGLTLS